MKRKVLSRLNYKGFQQMKRFAKNCENIRSDFANLFAKFGIFFAKMNEVKNEKTKRNFAKMFKKP